MSTKIENLKKAQMLSDKMHEGIKKFNDCTRGFTGNVQEDLKIQQRNIAESQEAWHKATELAAALTKSAFKGGEAFAKAVNDAENFIQEFSA